MLIQGSQLVTSQPQASQQLANSFSQLNQVTGISDISSRIEMVQKGMLVYSRSKIILGAQLAPSQQLAKTSCYWLQLARASYGYLNCLRTEGNGSKWNFGLLNEQNEARDIASQYQATRCHQLQLVQLAMADSAVSSMIRMAQKGKLVCSMSRMKLWAHSYPLKPLGVNSCIASYSSYSYLNLFKSD